MSLGICALRSVFLGEQKLKLSPVLQLGAYTSPLEVVSYFLVISFFECRLSITVAKSVCMWVCESTYACTLGKKHHLKKKI